eukprot:2480178-Prymnesium_polylepis.1
MSCPTQTPQGPPAPGPGPILPKPPSCHRVIKQTNKPPRGHIRRRHTRQTHARQRDNQTQRGE